MERYFTYGSNMNEHQMRTRLPSATFVSLGVLPDFRIALVQYRTHWRGAVLGALPSAGSQVEGVIYSIEEKDLMTLDFYQGVLTGESRRVKRQVIEEDGQPVMVWTYSLTQVSGIHLVPSALYTKRVLEGAMARSLSPKYLNELESVLLEPQEQPLVAETNLAATGTDGIKH